MRKPSRIVSCLLLAVLFLWNCSTEANQKKIAQDIAKINKKCPTMVDSETMLLHVKLGEANDIIYSYRLMTLSIDRIDTAMFYKYLWPGLLSHIKVENDLQSLRESGYTFVYFYEDQNKVPVYTFRITPEVYNKE